MRKFIFPLLSVIALSAMPLAASAQLEAVRTGDVRVSGDTRVAGGGLNGDENGGFTSLIVGINTNLIENWALVGFDTTGAEGQTATGAEFTINVQTGFGGGANHGSEADTFTLHNVFASNTGWDEGTQSISASDAEADSGAVTFLQRAYQEDNWKDASGADVSDFYGAFDPTPISTAETINGWVSGSAPDSITFNITDAALAQTWLDNGSADVVIQVNDDGSDTSRFNLTNGSAQLTILTGDVGGGGLSGDFNGDEVLDGSDVDSLVSSITSGNFDASFDLDGDGSLDSADLSEWLTTAGANNLASENPYLVGDANLDGTVDSTDLGLLLNNFSGNDVGYTGGDLNTDSLVNSTDLGLLLNNFNANAASASQVPEPNGLTTIVLAMLLLSRSLRRRRSIR